MNNLFTYNDYLNEGLFSSKYASLVDKIYNYILKINIDYIIKNRDRDNYSFIIKNKKPDDLDPYGEEIWEGEDIKVELQKEYTDNMFRDYDYKLFLNGDKVDVSNAEAKKLYNAIRERFDNIKNDEKQKRINAAINKIKYE